MKRRGVGLGWWGLLMKVGGVGEKVRGGGNRIAGFRGKGGADGMVWPAFDPRWPFDPGILV